MSRTTRKQQLQDVQKHFNEVAHRYEEFKTKLESWYAPPWSAKPNISKWIGKLNPKNILEIGCGTGDIARHICSLYNDICYLNYDLCEEMLAASQCSKGLPNRSCTSRLEDVKRAAKRKPFDMTIASFTLHDHPDLADSLKFMCSSITHKGHILIMDMAADDLPFLTINLQKRLKDSVSGRDSRLCGRKLRELACDLGLTCIHIEISSLTVTFPTWKDLDSYFEIFGIYLGMDLPLGFTTMEPDESRSRILSIISRWSYPLKDERQFITCVLQKK